MADKLHYTEVTGETLAVLLAGGADIDKPFLIANGGKYYAKADELRAWQCFSNTSEVNPNG